MSSGCIGWPPSRRPHLQGCLTVALAVGILPLGGQTAAGRSGRSQVEPGWTFCVNVYDLAAVSPGTLANAVKVSRSVLAAARIPTQWHTSAVERGEDSKTSRPSGYAPGTPDRRGCLAVSIVRGVSPDASAEALGFVMANRQSSPGVTIFYDRLERIEMQAVSASASLAQILGYAIAHEIGHVLLGSTRHSDKGIMKGPWTQIEFERMAKGWLAFTTQQSAVMRQRAFRQAALRQSAQLTSKSQPRY